jgi:hypothetical protein
MEAEASVLEKASVAQEIGAGDNKTRNKATTECLPSDVLIHTAFLFPPTQTRQDGCNDAQPEEKTDWRSQKWPTCNHLAESAA